MVAADGTTLPVPPEAMPYCAQIVAHSFELIKPVITVFLLFPFAISKSQYFNPVESGSLLKKVLYRRVIKLESE